MSSEDHRMTDNSLVQYRKESRENFDLLVSCRESLTECRSDLLSANQRIDELNSMIVNLREILHQDELHKFWKIVDDQVKANMALNSDPATLSKLQIELLIDRTTDYWIENNRGKAIEIYNLSLAKGVSSEKIQKYKDRMAQFLYGGSGSAFAVYATTDGQ